MKRKWEIVFCGVGGQGLLLDGTVLGSAASVLEKRRAVMTSAYGSETRGTFTKSDLILSEDDIDFPEVLEPDVVVALAQVAYDRYVGAMKEGSTLLYNSDEIREAPSKAKQYGLPMEKLAAAVGNPGGVNVVALGALIAVTGCAQADTVKKMLAKRFQGKEKIVEGNAKAFDSGYRAVKTP